MPISRQRFSDLIGSIYDCAIDPEGWPSAIEHICRELSCVCGLILITDVQRAHVSYAKAWNYDLPDADAIGAFGEYFRRLSSFLLNRALDEPFAGSRIDFSRIDGGGAPIYLEHQPAQHPLAVTQISDTDKEEWVNSIVESARKTGHYDSLSTIVLRDRSRIGIFSLVRNEAGGFVTDDDLGTLALLAPHVRRAITISDILNLKTVEAQALGATLDKLALGVVVIAADSHILYANEAATRMFAAHDPVQAVQGRLVAGGPAQTELGRAITLAATDEADIGKLGIGISLRCADGGAAIAHVLPLARGEVRGRLVPQAAAAVFVAQPGKGSPTDLAAFAETFMLTPGETRVLQQLVQAGGTMLDVANALSVSEATAKTHLSHILAKTGVGRQAELITLVRDLIPPIQNGG